MPDPKPTRRVLSRIGDWVTGEPDEYVDAVDPVAADHWNAEIWGPLRGNNSR